MTDGSETCETSLTHWRQVTHICVGNLTIIGPDNGLSPGRRQAIIWTNAGILLIGPWGTNFSELLIGIQTFSVKKMHLKMSSAKWRPFCRGLNVLIAVAIYTTIETWQFLMQLQRIPIWSTTHICQCQAHSLQLVPSHKEILIGRSFQHVLPDSMVHGANMWPIWGRQDPGGSHVGPMNHAIWVKLALFASWVLWKHINPRRVCEKHIFYRLGNSLPDRRPNKIFKALNASTALMPV